MTDTSESTRRMSRPLGTSVIYSVHELVQQAKLHRQQFQPAVTPGKWQMGDPRNGTTTIGKFRDRCGAIVNSFLCQTASTTILIFNAILMGVMTFDFVKDDPALFAKLDTLDMSILCAFTVEFTLQLIYLGWELRKNGWLVFDGLIVTSSWAFAGSPVQQLRSFRIFRVFSLISRLESLKTLISAIGHSVPQMGSIWLILGMFFYVFAVLFTNLYSNLYDEGFLDYDYFGRLDYTFFSLFQFMTMDGWTDVVRQVSAAVPLASIGFVIFVICTGFVVLNLMIAVVCESLMNVKEIEAAKQREKENEIAAGVGPAESFEDEPDDSWAKKAGVSQRRTVDQIQLIKQDLERVKDEVQKSLADINEEMIRTRETVNAILLRLP